MLAASKARQNLKMSITRPSPRARGPSRAPHKLYIGQPTGSPPHLLGPTRGPVGGFWIFPRAGLARQDWDPARHFFYG